MIECLVVTNNGTMEMPIAAAVAAHVQFQGFLKCRRINPFIEEGRRKFLDDARLHPRLLSIGFLRSWLQFRRLAGLTNRRPAG
jgi:hypothetical protein